jgi:hypothetical protein
MDRRSPWNYKFRSQYANYKAIIQHIRDPDQLGLDSIDSQKNKVFFKDMLGAQHAPRIENE